MSGPLVEDESADQGEGFEQFFDDADDTQDDPYKSLGPHHAEIPVPLKSDDPFLKGWLEQEESRGPETAGQIQAIQPLEVLRAQQNIDDYVNGRKSFEEVTDDYAVLYAEKVLSNKIFSYKELYGNATLSKRQRRTIRERAYEQKLIPNVPMKPGTNYPDFLAAGLIYKINDTPAILSLPQNLWHSRDRVQFAWLDKALLAQTGQSRPAGQVWHHSEIPGQMELVPFGIHNIIYHKGGRSPGGWAYGAR